MLIITESMGIPLSKNLDHLDQLQKLGYKLNEKKNGIEIDEFAFSFQRTETFTHIVAHSHCKALKGRDERYYFIYYHEGTEKDILTLLEELVFKAENEIKAYKMEITDIEESFYLFKSLKNVINNKQNFQNNTKLIDAVCKCYDDKKPVQLEADGVEKPIYFLIELCSRCKELNYVIDFVNYSIEKYYGVIRVYINQNKGKEIKPVKQFESYYNELIKIEEQSLELSKKGDMLYDSGKYEEAIKCYDKAIELNPKNEFRWFYKGTALDKLGKYEEAIKCYDKAIELKPKYEDAWNGKGLVLYKLEKYEEAIKCFVKAIEINPKFEYAKINRRIAQENLEKQQLEEKKKKEAEEWFKEGKALRELGKYEEAIKCYDKIIEFDPNYEYSWNNKGIALDDLGNYEEAIKSYDKAIELNPNYEIAITNRRIAQEKLEKQHFEKKADEAITENQLNFLYNKGLSAYNSKDWDIAIDNFEQVINIDKNYLDTSKLLSLAKNEKFSKINKKTNEIKFIDGKTAEEWFREGITLKKSGRYDDAIKCFDKTIELNPKDVIAWNNKGIALKNLGRYDDAIKCFDKTIELAPKDVTAITNRKIAQENLEKQQFKNQDDEVIPKKEQKKTEETQNLRKSQDAQNQNRISKKFTNSIDMEFVLIPAGEFDMGSNDEYNNEKPIHRVKISYDFYMGKYEVTQKQWRDIMGNNPSYFKGDNLPVESVSWNDIQEFIKKLNEKEGEDKYRLPTEAEWEYVTRAGTKTKYYFGDGSKIGEYAWYNENSEYKTHVVGLKKPNQWGLYDTHGNVFEWVQDSWHNNYNGAPTDGSAWEKGDDFFRVFRGGSWFSYACNCRSAYRNFDDPSARGSYFGFRLLRSV